MIHNEQARKTIPILNLRPKTGFLMTMLKKPLSCLVTKPTIWLCPQRRLRSAWASAQSDQSLRCALCWRLRVQAIFMRTAKTLIRLGGCPGWSESLLGAHSLCWFCHEAAPLYHCYSLQGRGFGANITLSHVTRKPVFGVCDLVRLKPGCWATETNEVWVLKCWIQQVLVLYYPGSEQQRRWSDCADAKADLRLCCSHME